MRNRILAGLGVAALATVGVAAPANAVSDSTADVWVVHAIPGATVDVYLDGTRIIDDFVPGTFRPFVDLAPGDYTVEIVASDSDAPADGGAVIVDLDVTVAAGVSYTLVAQPGTGTPEITAFENDLTPAAAGNASVTVRHTANAPAVDVVALPNTVLFPGVTNGQEGNVTVPAGSYDLQVQVDGDDPQAVAIDLPDTVLAAGTHYFIHAFGAAGGPYSAIVFTIGDTPAGVPAGSAGLVAEEDANPALIAGGAALLALLVAGGVLFARRQAAESGR